jgi:hypothetical protein
MEIWMGLKGTKNLARWSCQFRHLTASIAQFTQANPLCPSTEITSSLSFSSTKEIDYTILFLTLYQSIQVADFHEREVSHDQIASISEVRNAHGGACESDVLRLLGMRETARGRYALRGGLFIRVVELEYQPVWL